jgi:hypothetical protein
MATSWFSNLGKLALGMVIAATSAATASAAVVGTWIEVPITAGAIASDPALAGFKTFDLQITTDSDWTNSTMRIALTTGSFYNQPGFGGSPGGDTVQPGFWGIVPSLEFDTAVAAPPSPSPWTPASLAGRHLIDGPGAPIFSPTLTSVSWFDTVNLGAGTFKIARVTISNDANGTILLDNFEAANAGIPQPVLGFAVVNGAIIPEPSTVVLLAMGLVGLAAAGWRRRRAA